MENILNKRKQEGLDELIYYSLSSVRPALLWIPESTYLQDPVLGTVDHFSTYDL